ncbi:MAG: hypothetical protein ACTSUO_10140 [Candidatus Thorarchaeota archaeon]
MPTHDYAKEREWYILLASDLHFGHKRFDKALFQEQFNKALELNAQILINGDVFDSIILGDKRYTVSGDVFHQDSLITEVLQMAYELLKPYAHLIRVIGLGNHETAFLARNGQDLIHMLLGYFAARDKLRIAAGGYTGFVRVPATYHGSGAMRKIDIFYNHGQGSSAEVTKGLIDLQRRGDIIADIVWLGHKHTRVAVSLDPLIYVNARGKVVVRTRLGVITGSYLKILRPEYDIDTHGYQLDYQEERMRVPSASGGIFLKFTVKGNGAPISASAITDV